MALSVAFVAFSMRASERSDPRGSETRGKNVANSLVLP